MDIHLLEMERNAVEAIDCDKLHLAIDFFQNCVDLATEPSEKSYYLIWLASVYEIDSQIGSAREILLRSIEIDPNPWSLVNAAFLEARFGKAEVAWKLVEELSERFIRNSLFTGNHGRALGKLRADLAAIEVILGSRS